MIKNRIKPCRYLRLKDENLEVECNRRAGYDSLVSAEEGKSASS